MHLLLETRSHEMKPGENYWPIIFSGIVRLLVITINVDIEHPTRYRACICFISTQCDLAHFSTLSDVALGHKVKRVLHRGKRMPLKL